jgi:hypothetical protein
MQCYQLGIGPVFQFYGKRFVKVAVSMAEDHQRWGHVFQAGTQVEVEGVQPLASAEEAWKWRPYDDTCRKPLSPAPGR